MSYPGYPGYPQVSEFMINKVDTNKRAAIMKLFVKCVLLFLLETSTIGLYYQGLPEPERRPVRVV